MSAGQYVVFSICKEEFAVPINDVKEVINYVKATQVPKMHEYFKGVINLRNELIPIIDLALKLGIYDNETKSNHILISETSERRSGFIVDEVKEVTELSDKNIKTVPYKIIDKKYVIGIGKLDDRLLILISLKKLLEE